MGADEFDGIPVDLSGPGISYTPLASTTSTANRTITATISDATAVDQTAGGGPRIYSENKWCKFGRYLLEYRR